MASLSGAMMLPGSLEKPSDAAIPAKIDDRAKWAAVVDFLKWVLTDGQKLAAPLDYAAVPENVAAQVIGSLEQIR